ncbi:ABC-three component system protein [Ralstonia solanacearum]|uniref:ABC-three component system protein n=1 Tax=Ralstonia solanacearum TaxID=305 RepID=UPI0001D93E0B|nr:ABC-three component system protein [Ralstonia solanacearum]KFX76708.1 hypothetical protein KR98_23310 [Ralstonia solanacearum]OCQ61506.1 hypothetical protein AR465_17495 [Ralstonia solanacearum]CBJ41543.1 protein of unknown function [Ralstonia solanacearum CFBP2957]
MELNPGISAEQRYWWRIALELRLRQSNSDGFQDFFSVVMGLLHGDDFVRVQPFGKLGDKGCDGYLNSSGQLFQCYGALNGESKQVATLIKKMKGDFGKAATKLAVIMREWHMVHNLIEGVPTEAITTLKELEVANPTIKFGFIGVEGFVERVFKLTVEQVSGLLGPTASPVDAKNLDISALRELVNDLAAAADAAQLAAVDLRPVPVDKLAYNQLPNHWKSLISGGWINAPVVASYFERHPDPLMGDKMAALFKGKYEYFKTQHLAPGDIMAALFELVTGVGNVLPPQQVAAQALLAFLFENCDIFERNPEGAVS